METRNEPRDVVDPDDDRGRRGDEDGDDGGHDRGGDTRWLDPDELEAWRVFVSLLAVLPHELEKPLEPFGLTFFEYQVLAGLSDAPDRTLAMSRLADWSNGSLSRLSHVVSRMERRGLVRRRRCPSDGRVTLATMTDAGHALLVRAAPAHVASVRTAMFDRLDHDQVVHLGMIGQTVLDGLGMVVPPPWEVDG